MARRRALVTGAAGFIGSHLVAELRRQEWHVVALDRRPVSAREPAGITVLEADLGDPEQMARLADRVGPMDTFFHLGAYIPHGPDANAIAPVVRANVLGTATLLDLFVASSAQAFVHASSLSIIGTPVHLPIREDHPVAAANPYSASKLAAELIAEETRRRTGRRIVSLRIASPYGPGMPETTVLPRFALAALQGREIGIYGSGSRTQTFVSVSDIARAFLRASERGAGIYNLGGPADVSMLDLANLAVSLAPGTETRVIHVDREDPQESCCWRLDLSKASAELSYEPRVKLEEGLAHYMDFLRTGQPWVPWWEER